MLRRQGWQATLPFKQMRVQDLRSDKINGVIISNPPYGERLSDDAGVAKLYAEMGQVFAPLKTWSKFILTSDESFETKYGSQAGKGATKTRSHLSSNHNCLDTEGS